jgi:hypothetical protein
MDQRRTADIGQQAVRGAVWVGLERAYPTPPNIGYDLCKLASPTPPIWGIYGRAVTNYRKETFVEIEC